MMLSLLPLVVVSLNTPDISSPQVRVENAADVASPQVRVENAADIASPQVRIENAADIASPQVRIENAADVASPQVRVENAADVASPQVRVEIDDMIVSTSPRAAQVRLADALAAADSIDGVRGRRNTVTFSITRGDRYVDLIATTKNGNVVHVSERDRGHGMHELGSLSWLVDTMKETVAVVRLEVDEDGAVTLTTDDGLRYIAIPGRGSGGNAAVEARWAAEWDREQG